MTTENTDTKQNRRRIEPGAEQKKLSFDDLPEAVAAVLDELADIKTEIQRLYVDTDKMTAAEACTYLCISRTTLYKLMKNNQLPHSRRGKTYIFLRSEIDKWMKRGTNKKQND